MITVSGHSDDIVSVGGDVNDEIDPNRTITIGDETRGVRVRFRYAAGPKSGAVWQGSIEQIDEGVPMFPVTVQEAPPSGMPDPRSYSVLFTIDCPPGTPVTVGKRNLAEASTQPAGASQLKQPEHTLQVAFDEPTWVQVEGLAVKTGTTRAGLVRRAVRILAIIMKRLDDGYQVGFLKRGENPIILELADKETT